MNLASYIVAAIIVLIVAANILRWVQNRRNGTGGCSCGCESCGSRGFCHPEKKEAQ